jgi:spermidine/putrescine transport system permease protein
VKKNYGRIYTLPITLWISVFFVVPVLIIFLYSFMKKALHGGVTASFSLDAYRALFNPVFAQVMFTTLWISLAATALTLVIALPCGYYMARSSRKNLLLFLIVIPFLTNFLIRIYAWIAILGNNGFLNDVLRFTGLTDNFVQFLYNRQAVIVVLVYSYLPYAILPLYSTIEKFDFSLLEAARDLGATHMESIFKVMIPNIRAGIISAVLFTFIPTFGAYAVPQLVGGKDSFMLGNIIARELTVTRNWPLASAISVLITLVTALALGVYMFVNRPHPQYKKEGAA